MSTIARWTLLTGFALAAGCADAPAPNRPGSAAAPTDAAPRFAPLDPAKTTTTASGLKIEEVAEGSGEPAKANDIVLVHYTGWLTSGKKFDSSHDRKQPFRFILGTGSVIKGWDEGVAGMKVNGVRKLHIPAALAYGEKGAGRDIPPDSELIFHVELVKLRPGPKIEELKTGEGAAARFGDMVRVHYVGKFPDGRQFDSSIGKEPFTFTLGGSRDVIQGWHAGIAGMKEGGKRRITIPPDLAYGPDGNGEVIPPNSTLVFDIELLKVRQ